MEVTYFHKNLSKAEEELFNDYVGQKIVKIEELLTKFADDANVMAVSIEKFKKHDAYEVEFRLKMPTKSLVAKEASHTINKAVDLSKDRLVAQVKKHMAQLRDRDHQSIRRMNIKKNEVMTEKSFLTE